MPDPREKNPDQLSRLLDSADDAGHTFSDADLRAMLEHQLNAPLEFDMELCSGELAARLSAYRAAGNVVPHRFADLLFDQSPPLELLELTRQFARANIEHDDPAIAEIATVIYYASIAAAVASAAARLTSASDESIAAGFRWGVEQPWMVERVRGLLDEGLNCIARDL